MATKYETVPLMSGRGPIPQYEVQWLAEFFHSFPHVNLSFKLINDTFDPFHTSYQESLIFIASLPVIWMLLTLIALTAYFCYRCCQPSDTLNIKAQRKPTCLKWSIAILVVITCATVGVGFFGNEELKKGSSTFVTAAKSADSRFEDIDFNVEGLNQVLDNTQHKGILVLEEKINTTRMDDATRTMLLKLTKDALSKIDFVQQKADKVLASSQVNITKVVEATEEFSFYRWISTIGLMCFLLVACLLFLLAVAKASKCLIIFCTCLTVFCLVLVWTVTGAYLGSSMAVGDFCVDPDTFIEEEAANSINPVILYYYMNCSQGMLNPFGEDLKDAQNYLKDATDAVSNLKDEFIAGNYFKMKKKREVKNLLNDIDKGLDKGFPFLQHLTSLVDCINLHKDYVNALDGICHTGLAGIAFILLSGAVIGLLFTIIIILASRVWRYFGHNSNKYEEQTDFEPTYSVACVGKEYATIDEDDPFIPRAQNSPSYHRYGSLNDIVSGCPSYAHGSPDQSSSGGRFSPPSLRMPGSTRHTGPEHLPLQGRQTPPPAYGDFYEDYNCTASGLGPAGTGTGTRGRRDPNAPVQV